MKRPGFKNRKNPMKRSNKQMKTRKALRNKPSKHDWPKMTEETYTNAGGACEWCKRPVPYGTLPAHIIPRSPTDLTLDENWNTSLLHIGGPACHTKFDANRAEAVKAMEAAGGCPLLTRIQTHPRLKEYFGILESKRQYIN
ncbi:hypothetical protein LCGC14_2238780 [marine sediment metagenome]|uniref:Uncharacterized protein n=1 Tax=marine sediment metagenome TaxID=412755 RepID=A0A0F9DTL8_9ZZZZ